MFRASAAATACSGFKMLKLDTLFRPSLNPKRLIYSDRFLGLTTVHAAQEKELLKLQATQNLENLKSRILLSADQGLLLSIDMDSISSMAIDVDDVMLYKTS